MRISELSHRSGVALSTLKFYLREGLLPPGETVAANQALYSEAHVQRLKLICALRDVAQLSVETIRTILACLDGPADERMEAIPATMDAIASARGPGDSPEAIRAAADVDGLLQQLGWNVRPGTGARLDLIEALVALRSVFDPQFPVEELACYGDALGQLARLEVAASEDRFLADPSSALEFAVVGTILFEPVIKAMRRLAHEHYYRPLMTATRPE